MGEAGAPASGPAVCPETRTGRGFVPGPRQTQPRGRRAGDGQLALAHPHLTGGVPDLPVVGPIFEEYINHGLLGLHRLTVHPRWLVCIREISEIRGSFRFGCGSAALCSLRLLVLLCGSRRRSPHRLPPGFLQRLEPALGLPLAHRHANQQPNPILGTTWKLSLPPFAAHPPYLDGEVPGELREAQPSPVAAAPSAARCSPARTILISVFSRSSWRWTCRSGKENRLAHVGASRRRDDVLALLPPSEETAHENQRGQDSSEVGGRFGNYGRGELGPECCVKV
jgi:hypothetical protein